MGNYIFIERKEGTLENLKTLFEKHFAKNKEQFKNDFGEYHKFEDMFIEYEAGHLDIDVPTYELKTGMMDKDFFPEFVKDIENNCNVVYRN